MPVSLGSNKAGGFVCQLSNPLIVLPSLILPLNINHLLKLVFYAQGQEGC